MRVNEVGFLRGAGLVALLAVMVAGCASSSWDGARRKDTVGAYHQFLRDHPNSRHSAEARERLAFLRVKTSPTLEGYEEFESVYPDGELTRELLQVVEPQYFEAARRDNSPQAYRAFLRRYPQGTMTARAQGNLYYVDQVRDEISPTRLRGFIESHPASDFVPEAQRTLALMHSRGSTSIRHLGVRVDVAPNVTQAERVRRGFASVVAEYYRDAGVRVSMIQPGDGASSNMDAWMRIDYHEAPASGTFGGRTLLSHCRVRLYHASVEEPVWDRKFDAPADHVLKGAYGRDKTVFGNSKYRFWQSFFVPVSTWATSQTRVHAHEWVEPVSSIDVQGDRAVILLERGGVDFMDVSSPLSPEIVDRYRRETDLSRWSGIEILDQRHTLIYGAAGAELLEMTDLGAQQVGRWDVSEVGAVHTVAAYDSRTVFLASAKGLFALRRHQKPMMPHRLLDGEVIGVKAQHPYVFVVRKDKVEVATAKHLLRHLTGTKLSLGKFRGTRVKVAGDSLFIFGKGHIAEVSVAEPMKPRVISLIKMEDLGRVADVAADPGHLYLLGDRGLQIAAPGAEWVADSVQVGAVDEVALKGRFAFLVGGKRLEVLDLTPFQGTPAAPAARDKASTPKKAEAAPPAAAAPEEAPAPAEAAATDETPAEETAAPDEPAVPSDPAAPSEAPDPNVPAAPQT